MKHVVYLLSLQLLCSWTQASRINNEPDPEGSGEMRLFEWFFHHNEYGWGHRIRTWDLHYTEFTRSILKLFENESDYMALWNW